MLDNLVKVFKPDPYRALGQLAPIMQKEGWRPVSFGVSGAQYTPNYNQAGTNVMIEGKPNGYVVLNVKHNGKADVLIRDRTGQKKDFIVKNDISVQDAHDYFTNQFSTIQQRVDDVTKGLVSR